MSFFRQYIPEPSELNSSPERWEVLGEIVEVVKVGVRNKGQATIGVYQVVSDKLDTFTTLESNLFLVDSETSDLLPRLLSIKKYVDNGHKLLTSKPRSQKFSYVEPPKPESRKAAKERRKVEREESKREMVADFIATRKV